MLHDTTIPLQIHGGMKAKLGKTGLPEMIHGAISWDLVAGFFQRLQKRRVGSNIILHGIWEFSVLSAQFFCKPKMTFRYTELKKKKKTIENI